MDKHPITPLGTSVLDSCKNVKKLLETRAKNDTKVESENKSTKGTTELSKRVTQIGESVQTGLYFANQLDAPILYKDWLNELQDMNTALLGDAKDPYEKFVELRCARYGV